MSVRALIITCLGIASGLFAAVGMTQLQSGRLNTQATEPPKTKVLVVKTKIDRGHAVKAEMVELKDWPEELVPDSTLQTVEEAVGRIALSHLMPGEPLMQGKLAAVGSSRGAGNLVHRGMRAYSILATSAASSVAGLVLPGDHVDVVLSMQSATGDYTGGGTSTTLLQNVEILAIDQDLEAPADNLPDAKLTTVTLLVTQRQAALLGLGQKAGNLTLSLRNPEDDEMADTEPVTLAEIRFREEPKTVEVAKEPELMAVFETSREPRFSTIRTMRGSQSGFVSVELGSSD